METARTLQDGYSQSQAEVMTESEMNNRAKGRRKKLACVECRQQKSKCDAYERSPESCTRCAKKNVPCVLQRGFRRTYKRARNEVLEKRFKELTKSLSSLSDVGAKEILKKIEAEQEALLDNSNFTKEKVKQLRESGRIDLDSTPNSSIPGSNNSSSNGTPVPNVTSASAFTTFTASKDTFSIDQPVDLTDEQLKCSSKSLGDIYMASEEISALFKEFSTKYHPFLPIVDITKGPERIYSLSPCLFWVIILIGLRRKFGAIELMTKLSTLVKSVLAEITISPIIRYAPTENDEPVLNVASVYSVQAFLLYTFWPPLTSSLSADTSWNTIGCAMFQAIRVGLNSAQFSTEYANANSELISEQIRTWVCCNIVSQTIASSFGFPVFVSFDHTVINTCKISSNAADQHNLVVPRSIKQMMQIAHFENQLTETMNSNPLHATGMVSGDEKLPLLHVLNQQLGELEIRLQNSGVDNIRKFLLLVAKVHLLTYYFTDACPTQRKSDSDIHGLSVREIETKFEIKRGLVKVYNAAVELLSHANAMWVSNPAIIKYFPGVFVLNIWQTACIISKLANSSLDSVLDVNIGKKVYQDAVSLTFNASVLKYDMAFRSSGIMRSIWSMFSNMHADWKRNNMNHGDQFSNDYNIGVTVKSRMSVSIFFDCLYILREKCGMAKLKREMRRDSSTDDRDDYDENMERTDGVNAGMNGKARRRLSAEKNPEENARKIIKTIPLDPEPINAPASSGSNMTSPGSQNSDVLSLKSILNKTSPKDDLRSQSLPPTKPFKQIPIDSQAPPATVDTTTRPQENIALSFVAKSPDFLQPFVDSTLQASSECISGSNQRLTSVASKQELIQLDSVQQPHLPKIGSPLASTFSSPNHQQRSDHRVLDKASDNSQHPALNGLIEQQIILQSTNQNNSNTNSRNNDNAGPAFSSVQNKSPIPMEHWDNWESDMVWKDVDLLMNEFAFNPTV